MDSLNNIIKSIDDFGVWHLADNSMLRAAISTSWKSSEIYGQK